MTLSRAASRDLIELWVYGARKWGIDRANAYYDKIDDALHLLVGYPEIGTLRVSGGKQYRRWVVGSHAIHFRAHRNEVFVIRILHAAMDERQHLS